MDQKPVAGHEALVPPDAETAQRYLDEARAVTGRRQRAVDPRALAWLQIANALVTAGFLVAYAVILRRNGAEGSQTVLFAFILWTQLASGLAQRSGMQWRMTRSRWPLLAAGAVIMIVVFVLFGFAVWDPALPEAAVLVPGAIFLVAFGGYGITQLVVASRGPQVPSPARAPLPTGIRVGTVLVGVAIGVLILLGGMPSGVLGSVLVLLVALLLIAWFVAGRSEIGLPGIGAAWRWPHFAAFTLSAVALLTLSLTDRIAFGPHLLASMLAGAGVVVLLSAVSFVSGRDLRD